MRPTGDFSYGAAWALTLVECVIAAVPVSICVMWWYQFFDPRRRTS